MNRYFTEVSYNKTWITGDTVQDWIMMPRKFSEYGPFGYGGRYYQFADAVITASDSQVDFRKYDYVLVFIPGVREFISYAIWGRSIQTQDGVSVTRIAFLTEYHQERFVFHEFAHLLGGLPDQYDYDLAARESQGYSTIDAGIYVGEWDLMGFSPTMWVTPQLMAFNKIKLGWITTEEIRVVSLGQSATTGINPIESKSEDIYAIRIPLTAQVYYLVEVRARIGYDEDLPDEGVLVSLVNERRESGHGIVRVQDADPATPTLGDATFDLRVGKQAGFFDRKNDLSIVITRKVGLSYTLFLGPVSQGEAALKQAELALPAMKAIDEANGSIQKALAEGRSEGIDLAKVLLANASAAFDRGEYNQTLELAQDAADLASRAVAPQVMSTTATSTTATQPSIRTYSTEEETPAQSSIGQTAAAISAGIVVIGALAILYRRRQVSRRNR
jgi:M6 family metalloprotease-like protein